MRNLFSSFKVLGGLSGGVTLGVMIRYKVDSDRDQRLLRHFTSTTETVVDTGDAFNVTYVHKDLRHLHFGPCLDEMLRDEMRYRYVDTVLFLPSFTKRLSRLLSRSNCEISTKQICVNTTSSDENTIKIARELVHNNTIRVVFTHVDIPQILEHTEENAQILFPVIETTKHVKLKSIPELQHGGGSFAFLRFLSLQNEQIVSLHFSDEIILRDFKVMYPDQSEPLEVLNMIVAELLRYDLVRLVMKPKTYWDDDEDNTSFIRFETRDLNHPFFSETLQKKFQLQLNVSNLRLDYATTPSLLQFDKTLDQRYLEIDSAQVQKQREHFTQEVERIMPILDAQDEEKRILGLLEIDRFERQLISSEEEIERRRVSIIAHYAASAKSQGNLYTHHSHLSDDQ
jgi:hypothetical protein